MAMTSAVSSGQIQAPRKNRRRLGGALREP